MAIAVNEARQQRATELRDAFLRLLDDKGRWEKTTIGECRTFESSPFKVMLSIRPASRIPNDGPYGLDVWLAGKGEVLFLVWSSVGAEPSIVTFKRGDWEAHALGLTHPH